MIISFSSTARIHARLLHYYDHYSYHYLICACSEDHVILVSTLRGTLDTMSMINATVFCVSTRSSVLCINQKNCFSVANYCGGATRLYFSSIFNGELKGRFDDLHSYQTQYHKEMAFINHLILYTMQLRQASAITTESSCQTENIAICSQCAACKEYQPYGTV